LWIEGEVTELRRQQRWASVFFTLKDPENGACLPVQMPRGQFDALDLNLQEGERVHVFGRAELYEQRGELRLKALTVERFGLGAHLAALERLKKQLAAEGLFAAERKRPLPRFPALIGLVTGNDAAAKRDVLTHIVQRFPPANVLVAETYVQGPRAPSSIATAIGDLCRRGVDVIVLARGGGSFEDLLPFSDERVVRAVAGCAVPIVSAVGHEQDTPLCDLAADVRASTPTARSTATRSGLPRRTSASVAHPCSRSSAGAHASTRSRRASRRSARSRRSSAATRSSTAATSLSGRPARSTPVTRSTCASPTEPSERPLAEPTFEEAQAELEAIVAKLERGDVGVDELTKLWERGEELYRICAAKLEVVQGKIEELRQLDESTS
jgi:exodeoxyribonuclease VII large subunit